MITPVLHRLGSLRLATAAACCSILVVSLAGCVGEPTAEGGAGSAVEAQRIRFGHYNIRELTTAKLTGDSRQVRAAVDIIARFAPDILSINELQHDLEGVPTAGLPGAPVETPIGTSCEGRNARRLADRITAAHPELRYDYTLVTFGNSGMPYVSADGAELPDELKLRGFGEWQGRFNIAILSKFPILHDQVRVVPDFPWSALPDNRIARIEEEMGIVIPADFPLFEKALVVVPIDVSGTILHVVMLHPVSAGFSDMNPHRNHDELRALALFLDGQLPGVEPLPADARFIVVGDLNADPEDGDGDHDVITALATHPKVITHFAEGAGGARGTHPERNSFLSGCGKDDGSIVQNPGSRLQLQLDYILPSATLGAPVASGIFWPKKSTDYADYALACRASDHRFVWADLDVH